MSKAKAQVDGKVTYTGVYEKLSIQYCVSDLVLKPLLIRNSGSMRKNMGLIICKYLDNHIRGTGVCGDKKLKKRLAKSLLGYQIKKIKFCN